MTVTVTLTGDVTVPLFLKKHACLARTFEHKTQQMLHLRYQVLFYGHRMKLQLSCFVIVIGQLLPYVFFYK